MNLGGEKLIAELVREYWVKSKGSRPRNRPGGSGPEEVTWLKP